MIAKAEAKNIWVLAEQRGGKVANVSMEGIGLARKLADSSSQEVWAVLLGQGVEGLAQGLIQAGADVVLVAESPKLDAYRDDPYVDVLAHLGPGAQG